MNAPEDDVEGLRLTIGGLTRRVLLDHLATARVAFNAHAVSLLLEQAFDAPPVEIIDVRLVTVGRLAPVGDATLPSLVRAAAEGSLHPCPLITAAWMRLVMADQADALIPS